MPTPADFPPPPTYALPVLVDELTKEMKFNPIWLEWFLRLGAVISAGGGGGGGGGLFHNLLNGLQGGAADEYFHLNEALYNDLVAGGAFETVQVPGEASVVAAGYQDTLNLESASAEIVITTDAGTKTVTLTFAGGSGLPPDGDYGDVVVSGSGTIWTVKASAVESKGYWSPLTDGDLAAPELIFAAGDTISVWTPTP